jgi:hypothetical protein
MMGVKTEKRARVHDYLEVVLRVRLPETRRPGGARRNEVLELFRRLTPMIAWDHAPRRHAIQTITLGSST